MSSELFQKYQLIGYDIDGTGEKHLAVNIFQRAKIRDLLRNQYLVFYAYNVKDGETPEIIASKLYGASTYHWLVLYANDIVDPYYDWPMSSDNLILTIRKKYTTPNQEGLLYAYSTIHHYADVHGNVIDETTFKTLPVAERSQVSVYDWEISQNEAKRSILLLDKKFVDQIDLQMTNIMST